MNGQLTSIFTTLRAYPNGAHSLERAIERAFHQCTLAVQQFDDRHGIMITPYNPGLWVDKSERNINYKLSIPQTDIPKGRCTCIVGNRFAKTLLGGGLVPTARSILRSDKAVALVITLGKYETLLPSYVGRLQELAKEIDSKIYLKEYRKETCWQIDGVTDIQKYSLSNG